MEGERGEKQGGGGVLLAISKGPTKRFMPLKERLSLSLCLVGQGAVQITPSKKEGIESSQ